MFIRLFSYFNMESFFATLKKEELYRTNYTSIAHLKESVKKFINFYNKKRLHSSLRYISPTEKERRYLSKYGGS